MVRTSRLINLLSPEYFIHDSLESFHTKHFDPGVITGAQIFAEGIDDFAHLTTVRDRTWYDELFYFFWRPGFDSVIIIDKKELQSYYELAGIYTKCRNVIPLDKFHDFIEREYEDIGPKPDHWIQMFDEHVSEITRVMATLGTHFNPKAN